MRKRNIRIFGLVFVVLGLILSVNSLRMTGFAVFESVEGTASSIIGILLVVGGIVFLNFSRTEKEIKLYHASPPGGYRAGMLLDRKKVEHGGFHMATDQEDAVQAVTEVKPNVNPDRVSVVEVEIPERYAGIMEKTLGTSSQPYYTIPPENFSRFNQLLTEGKVHMRRAPARLESLAGYR